MTLPFHEAIHHVLGGLRAFREPASWSSWVAYDKALHGYPLTDAELPIFRRHTGRQAPRPGGYSEGVAITGRQSGKTEWQGTRIGYEAAVAAATGIEQRGLYYVIAAKDSRSAMRAAFAPVRAVFDLPMFRPLVAADRQDSLELTSGATIAVYPARPAALRGLRDAAVYLDELAFLIATDGRPTDVEMLRAARPSLATTGGKLYITSSPMGQAGALYDLFVKHYGREDSSVLVWRASAPEMNSTLPADYLARMEEDDPEAYRSEVLGEFRAGISSLLDSAALDEVVMRGVREVPPKAGTPYRGHFDASGGRADSSALAIGRRDGRLVRVECVRIWRPPFNPEDAIREAAAILKTYGCRAVQIDRFAAPFVAQAFARHGIRAEVATATTSEHHLGLVPHVNAQTVALPDVPELLRELRGLIRQAGRNRDSACHVRGQHDDAAAAVSGLVALLARRRPGDTGVTIGPPRQEQDEPASDGALATYRRGVARITSGNLEDLAKTHGAPGYEDNPDRWT